MTLEEFKASLKHNQPPKNIADSLKALWFDAKDEWGKAHLIAQEINDVTGAWVHGYLHRKEGDLANASYWYSRAGKSVPNQTLPEEWVSIVKSLL